MHVALHRETALMPSDTNRYPLTAYQRDIWTITELFPGVPSYVNAVVAHLVEVAIERVAPVSGRPPSFEACHDRPPAPGCYHRGTVAAPRVYLHYTPTRA